MGSKGGGTTKQVTQPWSGVQPYLRQLYGSASDLIQTPQQYYPNQTYVGALPSEEQGYLQRSLYNNQMFGSPIGAIGQWPAGPTSPGSPPNAGWSPSQAMTSSLGGIGSKFGGGQTLPTGAGGAPTTQTPQTPTAGIQSATTPTQLVNQYGPSVTSTSPFGNVVGSMQRSVTGQDPLGWMSGTLAQPVTQGLLSNFAQGAPQIGQYGFSTQLDPWSLTPTFGQAGGLDARAALQQAMYGAPDWGTAGTVTAAGNAPLSSQPNWAGALGTAGLANAGLGQFGTAGNLNATAAIQQALSGQPDYSGLNQAIEAANAPILRQFQQEILPGLNQRATFLNNETGGIKTLNAVLPEIGQRMSENAMALTEAERQRALASQAQAASLVSQGGLQQGAQASSQLFGAGQSALDRAAQQASQMGAQAYGAFGQAAGQSAQDRLNAANLVSTGGLSAYGLGLQGATTEAGLQQALAQMQQSGALSNANLANQYQQNLLGLGGLTQGLLGDQATSAARWGALFPSLAAAGQQPSADALAYGSYQRGIEENALSDLMNRWNFSQQAPYNQLSFLNQILSGTSGLGGTTTTTGAGGGASAAGALGGALGTYGLANAAGLTAGGGSIPLASAAAASPYLWPLVIAGGLFGSGILG